MKEGKETKDSHEFLLYREINPMNKIGGYFITELLELFAKSYFIVNPAKYVQQLQDRIKELEEENEQLLKDWSKASADLAHMKVNDLKELEGSDK